MKQTAMSELPASFEKYWSPEQIDGAIKSHLDFMRSVTEKSYPTKEEHDAVSKGERQRLGQESFNSIVSSIDTSQLSPFQKFLFWIGNWWYYNPQIRRRIYLDGNSVHEESCKLLRQFLIPALTPKIQETVSGMEVIEATIGFGHFAILLNDRAREIRRIITDTELFEIHGVYGYNYLDISPDGKPFARCVTDRGGGRAFFDGTRLMALDLFMTCAPKVAFFNGGYAVNSTAVTIVNGSLLPLIEEKDRVAHTTGAFMGHVDFSNTDALESYRLTDENASRLSTENGSVFLDGKVVRPIGKFKPSRQIQLDSGFTLFDYAEFVPNTDCAYDHVMVVDDKGSWIDSVVASFPEVKQIDQVCTQSAETAMAEIVEKKPEVVLLDMHLTEGERFEGLWIAREVKRAGFAGRILIASSYDDEVLAAMSVLTGGLEAPGKNLVQIKKLLSSRQ